jgi:hypothetical protein
MIRSFLRVAALVALVVAASPLGVTPVHASTTVEVDPEAKLVAGGLVSVRLTVTCDPGREVLEAHLRVSQDDQRISGTAAISRIRCDDRARTIKVRVAPLEGAFHEGEAFASAFILRLDPTTGATEQAQDARAIAVK